MSRVLGSAGETGRALAAAAANVVHSAALTEAFEAPHFRYEFACYAPRDRRAALELRTAIAREEAAALRGPRAPRNRFLRVIHGMRDRRQVWSPSRLGALLRELYELPHELAWRGVFVNLVVTVGKNDILTHEFAGSSYTAAWYLGLVDGTTAPTFAATDTMASHPGWVENVDFTQTARPAAAFGAASAGSIALASAAVYSINASATIAGAFFTTNSTLSGTTGTLYSAGAFTGGNQPVTTTSTLNVSWTGSM